MNSPIQAPTPPNKMGRKGGRPTPKSGGRPAPPPRKNNPSNIKTPNSIDSYGSKMNEDTGSNANSTKKQMRQSGNNGNDSDSSLEISWSEQLKQDEERAKREAETKVKLPQI